MAVPTLKDPLLLRRQCFIGGEWRDADDGRVIDVTNPADGSVVASVPRMGAGETRRAIESAEQAQSGWRELSGKQRAAILRKWFDLLIENQDDLAAIMTAEQGKPLFEARGEIAYAASYIEWFGEEAKRVYGDTIPAPTPDKRIVVIKQPIGVCAAITPWNFPAAMITRKVGPGLAAGCTMIIKPASQTPLSALALCVLAERAGVPKGVLSCVTGSAGDIGAELTSNPAVRKLSFTGSTEIGKVLMVQCAATVKRTSMELGGNAPFIVFDDADVGAAVKGAIASKYRNAGQTCVCANRFLVQSGIYDTFVARLSDAVSQLSVGDGFASGVQIGPLIDEKAVAKVEELVSDAISHGGRVVAGGGRHALGHSFYQPTVIADVSSKSQIFGEEIFGPVAPIFRFETESEAIELANKTQFGLAAYFYGRDISRIWRVAEALEAGIIGINEGLISTEVAPFGGVKESGNGREGSKYGMDDYLEIKYLCMGV
ncbi:NAD-dependent succinate-semialdehyde dehydrogenase [Rhizobium sp. R634]|uniref:NAD-dependent succinate-semialdehyde dehydrogenase n=1 Tax=Rhizobium sp. R634 TaxID=1764274 RepID=UPI000B5300CA|nr:NAD-dependent succinate-semialdehyde dehydrogenase [Rhizobium sp. R634]OWV73159.1 NAD-dependent succinate-semialdehyde dehydrogenase [Rhizobium sp. R634]OWV73378.1 NAD-dependent succinate-semialdehyde dehydrogenase [Rhizobium sp. R634]